jgi:hypothetical protein
LSRYRFRSATGQACWDKVGARFSTKAGCVQHGGLGSVRDRVGCGFQRQARLGGKIRWIAGGPPRLMREAHGFPHDKTYERGWFESLSGAATRIGSSNEEVVRNNASIAFESSIACNTASRSNRNGSENNLKA